MRADNRFAEDIEGFVRQRSFQLRKNRVFFCIDVPRETFGQRRDMHTDVRIGRMRSAQQPQRGKNARSFFVRLHGPLLAAQPARTRNVDVRLFDAHMRLDSAHNRVDGLASACSTRLQSKPLEKLANVAMLLLQEIKCIHGPSPACVALPSAGIDGMSESSAAALNC